MKRNISVLSILVLSLLFYTAKLHSQSLSNTPCFPLTAATEWRDGSCSFVSTAGFSSGVSVDPTECGPGAVGVPDGWGWYVGTGNPNLISFEPVAGEDVLITIFELSGNPCSGAPFTYNACGDVFGAGGTETVVGGGNLGTIYGIMIEDASGGTGTVSGTLCMREITASGLDCNIPLNSTADTISCAMIGTPAFNEAVDPVFVEGSTSATIPSGAAAPSCGAIGGTTFGAWIHYDPINGVSAANLDISNLFDFNADIYVAYYQGSCGGLVQLDCRTLLVDQSPFAPALPPAFITGIDESQPIYVFVYSAAAFSFTANLHGFEAVAANDDCANAEMAGIRGCNVGATGAAFTPPTAATADPSICLGGMWSSNENTVYYAFTPTASNASLEIENIVCNDGESGLAQFGVWESCAAVNLLPSAANGFLGCAVGNSTLSLTGLNIGQQYVIVLDGNGGDLCKWDLVTTGGIVILYTNIERFEATNLEDEVQLDWRIDEYQQGMQFIVQRSSDGINYEDLYGEVEEIGITDFRLIDENPLAGQSYYRLKIIDLDASVSTSDVVTVARADLEIKNALFIHNLYPQPADDVINIELESGTAETLNIRLINQLGQVVHEQIELVGANAYRTISFSTTSFPGGVYTIVVEDPDSKQVRLKRIAIR
jgi:hypothetical protein